VTSNSVLPFIVAGIATGAIYGLAGSGLVITYKTSGVFNFAHGAIAALAAYIFYWLNVTEGLNWELSFVICVPVLSILLGLLLERGTRGLTRKPVALQIVATIGVILIIESLTTIKWGPDSLTLPDYLPGGESTFRVVGVNVGWTQVIIVVFALVVTGAVYLGLRFTKTGLAMRAVVDNPDLVGLHGTSPIQVRRMAWIAGAVLSSSSGVLLAPLVGIQSITLTYLIIAAIGSAAVGGFNSIPLTYVGGVLIGIVSSVSQKYVLPYPTLGGLPQSIPYIVLLIALVVIPRGRLVTRSSPEKAITIHQQSPPRLTFGMAGVVLVVLLLVPTFAGQNLTYYMVAMSSGIMFLSLGLLVRTAGQVSLCQSVFGAIGAVAFSQFAVTFKIPWLAALVLGSLVLVPVAALVALLAIRLSGLFLALATLAFALTVSYLLYPVSWFFGSGAAGRLVPRPSFAQSDDRYYYVLVFFFVLSAFVMLVIDRSRLGRMLKGLSESPIALRTMGLSINTSKILVFCISAFFAGLSGILYGGTVTYASYGDANYATFESLILIAIIVILPLGLPWLAIFAVPIAIIPGYISGSNTSNVLTLLFGVSAIIVALRGGQSPVPKPVEALYRRFSKASAKVQPDLDLDLRPIATSRNMEFSPGLEVRDLHVKFGGLVAVDGLQFEAPIGRVTGLIGPNGAGKTTTFNACSGVVRLAEGQILIHGNEVTGDSAATRARHGLGRTFQVTELCETLTVRENVAMGREAGIAGQNPISQIISSASDRRLVAKATDEAMALCGVQHLANVQAGSLSTGERRVVEVARCLAGDFDVLLLDEPSAGLDHRESDRLSKVLTKVITDRRCGILLVEHDMAFVMGLCDYIYVLDFGKLLFAGSPSEVAESPVVRAAYLGSSDVTSLVDEGSVVIAEVPS
jgi:ABC-type branched-subunit amino acid transport system ATPase component/branched-subunit amino acid ABC-type transport system permease component